MMVDGVWYKIEIQVQVVCWYADALIDICHGRFGLIVLFSHFQILNKIKENRWQELLCQLNVASVEDAEEKFPTVKGLIQLGIPGRDALRVYHQNTGSSLRELYDKVSNRRPCPAVVTMTDLTQREMDKWKRTRGHSPAPLSLSSRGASPLDETSDRSHSPVSHSSRSRASSEVPIPSIPLHLYRKPQSKKAPEPLFRKEDPSPSAYQSLCRPVRKSAQKAMELNARVNDIVDESDSDIEGWLVLYVALPLNFGFLLGFEIQL